MFKKMIKFSLFLFALSFTHVLAGINYNHAPDCHVTKLVRFNYYSISIVAFQVDKYPNSWFHFQSDDEKGLGEQDLSILLTAKSKNLPITFGECMNDGGSEFDWLTHIYLSVMNCTNQELFKLSSSIVSNYAFGIGLE